MSNNISLFQTLTKANAFLGNPKQAAVYFDRYTSLITERSNRNYLSSLTEMQTKYETENKEIQISALKKEKQLMTGLGIAGGAILLLALASILFLWRSTVHKRTLAETRIKQFEQEKQLAATEAVLKGEEQERTRLAKDLHDGLGGMLSGIKYSLNNMKENLIMTPDNAQAFERSMNMLDSSIGEMRRVAHNMMPEILVKYGLDTALKEFCREIDQSAAIHVSYQSIGMSDAVIEQTASIAVYRIMQELINNAMKHAAAKNVLVQVHFAEQEKLLAITVEDDGKGFDTALLQQSSGIGWSAIKNRVEFLKGKTDIKSMQDKGTSVLIEIPV
jgi:signal transduction histidine kinase